jgi:hypothetical protein
MYGSCTIRPLSDSCLLGAGMEDLILESLKHLRERRGLAWCLGATIILEQCLRRVFAVVNQLPGHFFALTGRYYTTLDGYGQRDRHQLLLHPRLEDGGGPNGVWDELGDGTLACLLDLFMFDGGPNIRYA